MSLKEEILRLLKEDIEFKYTVLGYLGLDEVIKSLRSLQKQALENIKAIRDLQRQVRSLQEQVFEHTKAIKALQKQVESLQQQVRSLQQQVFEHGKILMEHTKILERHTRVLEEHTKAIRALESRVIGLTSALFGIRHALGISLEEFARTFLRGLLEARGVPREKLKLERKIIRVNGREFEINIFNEEPLVVGEVTSIIEDIREVDKVIERVRVVEEVYGRKPDYIFLITPTIWRNVFRYVIEKTKENEIELIYGRVA